MSAYQNLTEVININQITRTLEDDLLNPANRDHFEENRLIQKAILSTVKKYFKYVSSSSNYYYNSR